MAFQKEQTHIKEVVNLSADSKHCVREGFYKKARQTEKFVAFL